MAAQKIVYLVTSGAYDSYTEEAIMATPELASALAEKLVYANIIPMPVLDYVPEKVTVYHISVPRPTTSKIGGKPLEGLALLQWCADLVNDIIPEVA